MRYPHPHGSVLQVSSILSENQNDRQIFHHVVSNGQYHVVFTEVLETGI